MTLFGGEWVTVSPTSLQCKEMCVEIQDQFLKELRDLSEVRSDVIIHYHK